jgi:hypothetical protein
MKNSITTHRTKMCLISTFYQFDLFFLSFPLRMVLPFAQNRLFLSTFALFMLFCVESGNSQIGSIQTGLSVNRDHDIAISNNGWKIEASIPQIVFNGGIPMSLDIFGNKFGPAGSMQDPDILYDPTIDRFFIIFLNNTTPKSLRLLRSVGPNPTDLFTDWTVYEYIPPTGFSVDFPRISVNQSKVLVSFKLSGGPSTVPSFFIADKNDLAAPVTYLTPNVSGDMQFLCPATPAETDDFDRTDFYLIGMKNLCTSGSNLIYIYHLETNGNISEMVKTGTITYYSTNSPNNYVHAPLFSNRAWSATISGNSIRFVSHIITDAAWSKVGIYLGEFDVDASQLTSELFFDSNENRAYPSVAYSPANSSTVIVFLSSNTSGSYWKAIIKNASTTTVHPILSTGYSGILGDYTCAQRIYNHPSAILISGQLSSTGYYTTVFGGIALPLELIGFDVKMKGNDLVSLVWKTQNEKNIATFEAQRSEDGIQWETIQNVEPKNLSEAQTYSIEDEISEQLKGKPLFYRIRIVENDGHEQFSPIRSLESNIQMNDEIMVYPNPTQNGVYVKWDYEGPAEVQVFDATGRLVLEDAVHFEEEPVFISFAHFQINTGYHTLVIVANGRKLVSKPFLVN